MLMICTSGCCNVVRNPPSGFFFNPLSLFCPDVSRLDVLLELLDAEVTVMVEFGQRLPHPQRCEAGLWALVPALLHDLHYGCQDLQDTMADVKTLPGQNEHLTRVPYCC